MRRDPLTDAMAGAAAGAIGVWALDRLDWFLMGQEPASARLQTRLARPDGQDPAHVIANRVARAVGTRLSPAQPNAAGLAVHYGLGMMMGAAYGALRNRLPAVGAGRGVPFGLAMFVLQDEGLNTLLGTGGPPGWYPWQTHARGAAAHALFGFVTDAVLRLLPRRHHTHGR